MQRDSRRPHQLRLILRVALSSFIVLFVTQAASGEGHTTLGAVEDVMLLPSGVTLPARIDTGAETTSLDAREIVLRDGQVEFRLPGACGGARLRLPLVRMARIRGTAGRQERPVVAMDLCIGMKKFPAEVTLTDRSPMRYPLLIGRNVLEKGFLVDVSRSRISKPVCD